LTQINSKFQNSTPPDHQPQTICSGSFHPSAPGQSTFTLASNHLYLIVRMSLTVGMIYSIPHAAGKSNGFFSAQPIRGRPAPEPQVFLCGVIYPASVLPPVLTVNAMPCNSLLTNYSIKWQAHRGTPRELKSNRTSHSNLWLCKNLGFCIFPLAKVVIGGGHFWRRGSAVGGFHLYHMQHRKILNNCSRSRQAH
jgi:hypothetical protein